MLQALSPRGAWQHVMARLSLRDELEEEVRVEVASLEGFEDEVIVDLVCRHCARAIQEHCGDAAVKKFKSVIAELDAVFVDQLVRNPECTFSEEVREEIEVVLLEIERKEEEEEKRKKQRRQAREAAAARREELEREASLEVIEDDEDEENPFASRN